MLFPLLLSLLLNLSLSLMCWGLLKLYKHSIREHAREVSKVLQSNTDLTDRLMHVQGVTWTPPPRPVPMEEDPETKVYEIEWEEA